MQNASGGKQGETSHDLRLRTRLDGAARPRRPTRRSARGRVREQEHIPRESHLHHGRQAAASQIDEAAWRSGIVITPAVGRLSRDTTDF